MKIDGSVQKVYPRPFLFHLDIIKKLGPLKNISKTTYRILI